MRRLSLLSMDAKRASVAMALLTVVSQVLLVGSLFSGPRGGTVNPVAPKVLAAEALAGPNLASNKELQSGPRRLS